MLMRVQVTDSFIGRIRRALRHLEEDAAEGLARKISRDRWPALARFFEIGAATSLLLGFATSDIAWYGGTVIAGLLGRGSAAQFALRANEPGHAATLLGLLALQAVLALAPVVRLALSWPRHRLLWLPVPLFFLLGVLSISPFPPRGPVWWFCLILTGVSGFVLARRKFGPIVVFLPVICLAVPHAWHVWGPLTHSTQSLAKSCPGNDGIRPRNLTPTMLVGSYHAVTPLTSRLWLLTGLEPDAPLLGIDDRPDQGRGGSWWLQDLGKAGLEVVGPSSVMGNLWRGCRLGDAIWVVRVRQLIRVKTQDGKQESVEKVLLAMRDMDVSEVACDELRGMVYFGEATQGGLWRWSTREASWTRWDLGRLGLFSRVRSDGRLVVASTDELIVFDPDQGRIIESQPAGYFIHGLDVCAQDGRAIVADLGGRVRLFSLDETGSYRLAGSVGIPAARRVAFSPDCAFAAVTSFDDQTVRVIRVAGLEEERRFRVGPVVRDVTFVGPRRFVVADACTATVIEW